MNNTTNTSGTQTSQGGGKSCAPNSLLGNSGTAGGHSPMATPYANDNASVAITGAGLSGIAGAAIAILQFLVAKRQLDLATNYYKTNKEDYEFYRTNYADFQVDANGDITGGSIGTGPLVTHKDQAFSTPFYSVDYLPMTAGALGRIKEYDEKWFQTRRRVHRYAVGLQRHTDYSFYMARRKAAMAAWLGGRRVEDGRKDWKDEQIQTHKVQALNFGITAGNIAKQGLASAVGTLEKAYDEFGSRLGGISSGLGRFSGYLSSKDSAQNQLNRSSNDGKNMVPHASGDS